MDHLSDLPPEHSLPVETPSISYASAQKDFHDSSAEGVALGPIASLAIQLLAIYVLYLSVPPVLAFLAGVSIRAFSSGSFTRDSEMLTAVFYAANSLFAVALLLFHRSISSWLVKQPKTLVGVRAHRSGRQMQAIAFSVLGLYLIVESIGNLVMACWKFSNMVGQDTVTGRLKYASPDFIQFAAKCFIGLWLFFGSKRLAHYWHSIRRPDLNPQPSNNVL